MYTTIKVSTQTKSVLDTMKIVDGETYEQIIEDLIEDHLTLNPQFKKDLEASRREYRQGKTVSFSAIKAKLKSE